MSNYTQSTILSKLHAAGLFLVPTQGKRPTVPNWQNLDAQIPLSAFKGYPNFGVLTGSPYQGHYLHFLDVDITDTSLADEMLAFIDRQFNALPLRTGKAPKFAIPVLLKESTTKLVSSVFIHPDKPDERQAIELLGRGQQCVVAGPYPESDFDYRWEDGTLLDPLRLFTLDELTSVFNEFDRLATAAGWTNTKGKTRPTDIAGSIQLPIPPVNTNPADLEKALVMLESIDCTGCDYDTWRNVGMALKQEFGDAGLELWARWSLTDPGRYDEDALLTSWQAFNRLPKGEGVSFGTVVHLAKEAGWEPRVLSDEDFLLEHIVTLPDGYYDLSTSGKYRNAAALNAMYGHRSLVTTNAQGEPTRVKPAAWLADRSDKLTAIGLAWQPVTVSQFQPIIDFDCRQMVNTYVPLTLNRVQGSVDNWLALVRYICGEYADLVLDHMAFTVQHPEVKIKWQILIHGAPRTGKTTVFTPCINVLGNYGASIPPEMSRSGWGDIYANHKAIILEEIFEYGHDLFNSMKVKLVNTGIDVLNIKGRGVMYQPNLYSIYMCSNHANAVAFNENEDKLLVLEAPSDRLDEAFYDAVFAEINGPNAREILYNWFMSRDISGFSAHKLPVRTAALKAMCQATKYDYERIIEEWLEDEVGPFTNPDVVKPEIVHKMLRAEGLSRVTLTSVRRVLKVLGYDGYQGQKRIGDKKLNIRFWSRNPMCKTMTVTELYIFAESPQ
jgi:hypothetical protein